MTPIMGMWPAAPHPHSHHQALMPPISDITSHPHPAAAGFSPNYWNHQTIAATAATIAAVATSNQQNWPAYAYPSQTIPPPNSWTQGQPFATHQSPLSFGQHSLPGANGTTGAHANNSVGPNVQNLNHQSTLPGGGAQPVAGTSVPQSPSGYMATHAPGNISQNGGSIPGIMISTMHSTAIANFTPEANNYGPNPRMLSNVSFATGGSFPNMSGLPTSTATTQISAGSSTVPWSNNTAFGAQVTSNQSSMCSGINQSEIGMQNNFNTNPHSQSFHGSRILPQNSNFHPFRRS